MTDLLDLFRAYPGGVAKLAEDASTSVDTLYRVANGSHARKPVRVLNALSQVLPERLLGVETTYDDLVRMWSGCAQKDD